MKRLTLILSLILGLTSSILIINKQTIAHASESIASEGITTSQPDTPVTPASSSGGGSSGETWNPLQIENGIPKLSHSVDYSTAPELLQYLKKGDLIYEPQAGATITGHTAMVLDIAYDTTYGQNYVLLLESVPSNGVCYGVLTPHRFNAQEGVIKRLKNVSESTIDAAVTWALSQIGKPYSIDTTKNPFDSNPNWYCSELIWAAFFWQGIGLDQNDNLAYDGSIVWPNEINASPLLTTIMQYNKTTTVITNNDTSHSITCNNETLTETHTYLPYNACYEKCSVCEHLHQINPHSYTIYRSCNDGINHRVLCACGETKGLEPCVGIPNNGITKCKKCNQKIAGFIPSLQSIDEDKDNKLI